MASCIIVVVEVAEFYFRTKGRIQLLAVSIEYLGILYFRNMDILPVNFKVLRFCGAWEEHEDRNFLVRLLHFFYRYAIVALIYHFTIFEMIELILTRDDIDDLTDGLFTGLTYLALCFKYGNFIMRKKEISVLLACFRHALCQSKNSVEKEILEKYNRKAKWCALTFMSISQLAGVAFIVVPILAPQGVEKPLPLKMYLPYSVSELLPYLATYVQQAAILIYGVLLNVSFDSLVYGFILRVCGQIELLCHRLTQLFENASASSDDQARSQRKLLLRKCIKHHVLIHEFVHRMQSLFVWTVTILFLSSLITLCTSIFRLSKEEVFSGEFLSLTIYLSCMLFQVFCYCWYGNELVVKSSNVADAVYHSNWTEATSQERNSLLILMIISRKGLRLSYYGIFALAIDSFTWIIKTSYSAFNLLQQMSD